MSQIIAGTMQAAWLRVNFLGLSQVCGTAEPAIGALNDPALGKQREALANGPELWTISTEWRSPDSPRR